MVAEQWHVSSTPLDDAAATLAEELGDAVELAPRLAIPGGSAAAVLGPLRARLSAARWARLRVTWVDERRVPVTSPDSNRGVAWRRGWLGTAAPVGLELPLWLDGETAPAAMRRVTTALKRDFDEGLDLVLLGLGEDGHVASLFPGHPALFATDPVVCVDDAPKPPPHRITLTPQLLATARMTVLVATGVAKRAALRRLRDGDAGLPAAGIARLSVFTDQRL